MRAWRKAFLAVLLLLAVIFAGANLILARLMTSRGGRPYRVEVNRIALQIERGGFESVDLSECRYVTGVVEEGGRPGGLFFESDSDYAVREIDGRLYRFDYEAEEAGAGAGIIAAVNAILTTMAAALIGGFLYVRERILSPFERLAEVPRELSKGNLVIPVRESRSRYFGRFLWGMDLLRETVEEQKRRELELQREKKTLLLSLSHDIKTPLSTIKLYAGALSKNLYPGEEKRREIAGSINAKADEIEGYVSRIITASREDFLSHDVRDAEFYLGDLARHIRAYYGEKLALVKTEFILGRYSDCLLSGDFDRSVEVLQNIIENAVKYGDGRRIEVLFPEEEEGVLITVRNSGCTLNREELPHIFESFWRGANVGKESGSGLGLYICRQLMHKMGGEVFAEIEGDLMAVTAVFCRA